MAAQQVFLASFLAFFLAAFLAAQQLFSICSFLLPHLGPQSCAQDVTDTAAAAITGIDNAFTDLADKRADLGAYMNRLSNALGNAETFAANMEDSKSRILDTDYAKEMTEFARAQIVRQAGMAMLSQANAIPNQVLQLLQ